MLYFHKPSCVFDFTIPFIQLVLFITGATHCTCYYCELITLTIVTIIIIYFLIHLFIHLFIYLSIYLFIYIYLFNVII